MIELMEHQLDAIAQMAPGKILYGGVGSGKTYTALGYYLANHKELDIYVVTTAKKRDSLDWERAGAGFGIGTERDATLAGVLTVDSWNNIGKYCDVKDAFFIFDEQRLVGSGLWVRSFLKIAKRNRWIMLSATPGDSWIDYAPVFIANGWYKNLSEFRMQHVQLAPFVKYPKIAGYVGTDKLERLRNNILVEMPYLSHTIPHMNYLEVDYDKVLWDKAVKGRWHVYENRPIKDVGELFRVMRRIANSHPSRLEQVRQLLKIHPRLIVYYSFNYELEILRGLANEGFNVAEWNGHRKQPIPDTDNWVYLVQYVAGAEAWECVQTNAMCHYSQTYSYKNFRQSLGRIDRLNTKYTDLYYYFVATSAPIDRMIRKALSQKKSFNERDYIKTVESW